MSTNFMLIILISVHQKINKIIINLLTPLHIILLEYMFISLSHMNITSIITNSRQSLTFMNNFISSLTIRLFQINSFLHINLIHRMFNHRLLCLNIHIYQFLFLIPKSFPIMRQFSFNPLLSQPHKITILYQIKTNIQSILLYLLNRWLIVFIEFCLHKHFLVLFFLLTLLRLTLLWNVYHLTYKY